MSNEILEKILEELKTINRKLAEKYPQKEEVVEKLIVKQDYLHQVEDVDDELYDITYTISPHPCKRCGGMVTWDKYPNPKFPVHVDAEGRIIKDGGCPNYE